MARISQRQSTGGRFKQRSASDLGSGAIKKQADVVVNSLKLQQARSSEYASDYVQGMKGVEQTEEWNSNLLSKLEDDVYQNKRDAIKVRQKREVESLQGKAKEYGKQAEFWKNFSTTYSKQWGKLAQGATDLGQRIQADKQLTEFYASENWQKLADIEGPVLDIYLKGIKANKDNPKSQQAIVELVSGLNHFARVDALQEMKKRIPDLLENLAAKLRENDKAWNKDTIAAHAQSLSNQIQIQYGLANTREGFAFNKHMMLNASDLIKTERENERVRKDKIKFDTSVQNVHSLLKNIDDLYPAGITNAKEKKHADNLVKVALSKAYIQAKSSWRKDSNGKVVKGLSGYNPMQILRVFAEEYSNYDSSHDGIREMIGKMPDPDNPYQTFEDRYKNIKGKANLEQMAHDISSGLAKKSEKKRKDAHAVKDEALVIETIDLIKTADFTTKDGQDKLKELEKRTEGFPNSSKLVQGALAFKYNELNINSLYSSLSQAFANGDRDHIASVVPYLPAAAKEFYMGEAEKVERFYSIFPKESINSEKSGVTQKVNSSTLELSNAEMGAAKQLYEQQLMNFAIDYMTNNPKAQDTDIRQYASQKAKEALNSGAGVWRIIKDPSGKGTFAAFVQDEIEWVNGKGRHNPLYSGLWRNDRLKRGMGVPSNEFEQKLLEHGLEGLLNHKDHGILWNLVNIDDVDKWLKKTIRGETIGTHPAVEALYKSQLRPGYSGRKYTRTEIMNIIAEKATSKRTEEYSTPNFRGSEGSTKVTTTKPRTEMKESELKDQKYYIEENNYIPQGQLDKAEHYVNASKVNIPNYRQYSVSDQTALGALLWSAGEDGKLPWSKQLEDLYSKSTELGVSPTELIDGDPNIINYNYFSLPRFRITTVRPR